MWRCWPRRAVCPARRRGGLLVLVPLLWRAEPIDPGAFRLTLLDVGQGFSAVLQTRSHTLVYDTGPRFSARFDAGRAVLIPFLRHAGVAAPDRVILSNGDSDHGGGFRSLNARLAVGSLWSGEPQAYSEFHAGPCLDGMRWEWDGVRFEVLHPPADGRWRGNNASCVLLIEGRGRRLLLGGDLEARAEQRLLRAHPEALTGVDLALIPHHGSLSSSTPAWVRRLAPRHALVSSGYANRYGFPRAEVVARWRAVGAEVFDTARSGAILYHSGWERPRRYRCRHGRYWQRQGVCDHGKSTLRQNSHYVAWRYASFSKYRIPPGY
ncbi:MAG: MBL fold metallo-hydrolase, partial [gamma proteobacterium symbiont of Phacoides pectinatus]